MEAEGAGADGLTPDDAAPRRGGRIFEHTFDTTDGTDADTSLAAAEPAGEEGQSGERQRPGEAEELNTTPGAGAGRDWGGWAHLCICEGRLPWCACFDVAAVLLRRWEPRPAGPGLFTRPTRSSPPLPACP